MPDIFVFGTLRHAPLLDLVAGEPVPTRPAHLPGFAAKCASGGDFPVLVADDTAAAPGLIATVSEDAMARLDWYEAISDYVTVELEADAGDGPHRVRVWRPTGDQPHDPEDWSLAAWQDGWAPTLMRAAGEVMELYGKSPVAPIARFWTNFLMRADSAVRADAMDRPRVGSDRRHDSVTLQGREITHLGYFMVRSEHLSHPTFAGGETPVLDRETFIAADAAVVLPYDPVRDRILLTEQFRMGPWCRGARYPWVLEPVAGRIDPGETPEACARRECVEEAGVEPDEMLPVAHYYPSTGSMTEFVYTYVGLCDLPDLPSGGGGVAHEGEDIKTHLLSFDEGMDLLSSGEAVDGPLILLMLWLQRERPRLRRAA
ncbi:NUDIX domain-containing protein [Pseudooceanicola sp. LIPI14-2-Ac024]|uniref:NUDIX domain-containing protein n=1 Tax=Pseudooceanicola sp. LIPI14-2-Ac024 TaxID=3344875 RepID=UPI0035D0EA8C